MHSYKSHPWKKGITTGVTLRATNQKIFTKGCHNVMPARFVGGCLLLTHREETTSSEAVGQHRIQDQKLSS